MTHDDDDDDGDDDDDDDNDTICSQAYPAPSYFWQFENGTRTQKVWCLTMMINYVQLLIIIIMALGESSGDGGNDDAHTDKVI